MGEPVDEKGTTEAEDWLGSASDKIDTAFQRLAEASRVEAAFGQPQTVGERTIIPVAEVFCGFGFGLGSGPVTAGRTMGGGGGAGGSARTRPMATIVVDGAEVQIKPVIDFTQILLAGLSAAMMTLLVFRRASRGAKKMDAANFRPSPRFLRSIFRR